MGSMQTRLSVRHPLSMRSLPLLLAVLVAVSLGPRVSAQEPAAEDVTTIDGIIRAYYEVVSGPPGGRIDVQRDRSLHHPDAWVSIAGADDGGPSVRVMTLEQYHGDNPARTTGFWEWETDRVVQRSGNLAHVWSSYVTATAQGGEPSGQGVNSITLFWDGERWWIMGWIFDATAGAASPGDSAEGS